MFDEMGATGRRYSDDDAVGGCRFALNESTVDRILPHREPWARRAPRVHDLVIASRLLCHPFDEVENEGFDVR